MYLISDERFETIEMMVRSLNDILDHSDKMTKEEVIRQLEPIVVQLQIVEHDGKSNKIDIVNCDDCVSLDAGANESYCWYNCKLFKHEVYPSFFCAYGERRKNDEDS